MSTNFISLFALQSSTIWGNGVLQAVIMFTVFMALIVALVLFMIGGKKKN